MDTLIRDALVELHDKSLPAVELLQTSFPDNTNFMINISTWFDPRYVFLIYAPILFALNQRVGHRLILALTAAEWSNQILKWLLAGERPYWYVHERANEMASAAAGGAANLPSHLPNFTTGIESYDMAAIILNGAQHSQRTQPLANFKQFPVTCEMGAGSPSGHAMVTATVWYVLIDAYLRGELNLLGGQQQQATPPLAGVAKQAASYLAKLSWSAYALILVLVSLSRVYLACHFPHQCLCGAVLGLAVARLVLQIPMEKLDRRHYAAATLFMFATAMGTYGLLRALGVDPLWTVNKALRWCAKREYIMLDTTPFFSMIRYLAFCLGAGLAFDASKLNSSEPEGHRLIGALSSVLFGQFLLSLPVPKAIPLVFYTISFLIYTLFSYSIAGPIPRLVNAITKY